MKIESIKKQAGDATEARPCAYKGCREIGLYPAPRKNGSARVPLYFCLIHIREYNAHWDALAGLSPQQIEERIRKSVIWERPTWPLGRAASNRIPRGGKSARMPKQISEALTVLGLSPPLSLEAVKRQYRQLAKKFHPDANAGARVKIEKFHALQQAYATLCAYYGRKKGGNEKEKK